MMNLWPSLSAWHFALAASIAAAGPVLIHLLNRRRYRTVQWAAMDFLREAVKRNRRILELRDLILMLLRALAVLLFGMALARPYFSADTQKYDGTQPLHAVLLVDNSLSMGYQSLAGTMLDEAKARAREFVDRLPKGSRVSIIPLCGSASGTSRDPYDTKEAALDALNRIEVVDRASSMARALNEARQACQSLPELAKRLVLLSDQQPGLWNNWGGPTSGALEGLPALQVVQVRADNWENSWISKLTVPDGLADSETPTTIIVEVQHRGASPRRDVQVTLSVNDQPVASQTVTIDPAEGGRQIVFEHVFNDQTPEAGREAFVPVKATLSPDNLPQDDERYLMVPVVATLPVVFIDQYGAEDEDPVRRKLGETRHLRRLLAPAARRADNAPPLVKVRHVKLSEVNRDLLADARLVVIAGVARPEDTVDLLREYVEQGGQLMIAAGGEFDPAAWNEAAWRDGAGILPAPLKDSAIGGTPDEAGQRLQMFQLSFDSLSANDYFHVPDTAEDDLRELYAEPFFFKAVEVDLSSETRDRLLKSETERIRDERMEAATAAARAKSGAASSTGAKDAGSKGNGAKGNGPKSGSDRDVAGESTRWLLWARNSAIETSDLPPEELAQRRLPRALARFSLESGAPFLVERPVGDGNVMFVSTGLLSEWNTLPQTNTMFLFDRLLRGMIEATLPPRNFDPQERLALPLTDVDPQQSLLLQRPGRAGADETIDFGNVGRDQRGVTLTNMLQRGFYRIARAGADEAVGAAGAPGAADGTGAGSAGAGAGRSSAGGSSAGGASPGGAAVVLATNGPADESDLAPLPPEKREQLEEDNRIRWIEPGESISLAGAQLRGQDSWWYLVFAVLVVLLVELVILGHASLSQGGATASKSAGG